MFASRLPEALCLSRAGWIHRTSDRCCFVKVVWNLVIAGTGTNLRTFFGSRCRVVLQKALFRNEGGWWFSVVPDARVAWFGILNCVFAGHFWLPSISLQCVCGVGLSSITSAPGLFCSRHEVTIGSRAREVLCQVAKSCNPRTGSQTNLMFLAACM